MSKLTFFLLFFCFTVAQAQYKKPYFNTLNVASGLPEANVSASLQDKYGYIWMGTQNGLVRYDGYKIKPYSMPNNDGHDLVTVLVYYLFEDGQGKLWVYVKSEGFYYFDRATDVFVKQRWKDAATDSVARTLENIFYWTVDKQSQVYWIGVQPLGQITFKLFYFNALQNTLEEYSSGRKGKNYIPSHQIIDIRKDANGKIWVVADSLLSYFDQRTKLFKPWFVLPENPNGNLFETFESDPVDADILWMNTYDTALGYNQQQATKVMKLIRFNTKTKQYKIFVPDAKSAGSLPANALQIFTDSLKRVWVSTKKGISLFNRQNATFTNYALSFPYNNASLLLAADKEGNLWISGIGLAVLHYLNTKSGVVTSYTATGDAGDLPTTNYSINKLFFDKSGTLWVSSPFAGISYLNRQKSLFAPIPVTPALVKASGNTKPSSFTICGSQGDSICFIHDKSSLYAWHSSTNRYDKIDLKNKDVYQGISNVVGSKDGSLWIASTQGLFNYNPLTKSTINYKQKPNDSLSLSSNYLSNLAIDKDGIIWIGTYIAGLCSFNKQTGKFTRYPFIYNDLTIKVNNALDDQNVFKTFFDSDGILWIGTNLGSLNRYDTKTGKFTSYLNRKDGFNCVVSIFEDSHKRLWVGTYLSGLFLFDRKTGTYKRYSEKDGLLGNNSQSITEDAAGNIWSFNERGMSRLNPYNNTITNFTEFKSEGRMLDGYKDAEGNFHFATKMGMVSFNPMQLNDNHIPPSVVIESVSYHAANTNTPADTVLFTEGRQKITFAYNENKVSFQYVALHFANASQNKYAYQLEGYDKDWVQAGTQRTATYTNLSPGEYTFKVKAANSDDVWNETGSSIIIIILPPWWKTWWAYIFYGILLLMAIFAVHRYQKERTIRIEREKTQKIELEQAREIEKAYTELKATQTQLIQSEKMASLGELTAGIAHEIQNPLNFVNNFSEVNKELIGEMKIEIEKGNFEEVKALVVDIESNEEKINHHGKRADSIVKSMLQHSRSSAGVKEPTDINALADEFLRLSYHGLRAKDKSFNTTMKTNFDQSIGKINIIPQDIGRVILNLLTNAFYAVNEKKKLNIDGYEPVVIITTKQNAGNIEIRVGDNGNGMPQKVLDKIFQPFFTTKPTGQGTGLGLSLSYDIVTKGHGGELTVKTKEGQGTEFIIVLKN